MQEFLNILLFGSMFSIALLVSSNLVIVHLVCPRAPSTNAPYFVLVVMIRKTGRVAQFWNKRETVSQNHLRKHVHLTNCIHLKHHIHLQKTMMRLELGQPPEVFLLKELSALKKSRSLRDPSTSPSRRSPSVGTLLRRFDRETGKDGFTHQASAGDQESRTLKRIVSIADSLTGNAARASTTHPSNVLEAGELSESRPGDGKQKEIVRSSHSLGEKSIYTLQHHGIQGNVRDLHSKVEKYMGSESEGHVGSFMNPDHSTLGPSQRPRASMQEDLEKGKQYTDISSMISGRVLGVGHGKDASSSRDQRADVSTFESEGETSTYGSDSTSKSKSWKRDIVAYRKRKMRRIGKSHLHSLSIGSDKERQLLYSGLSTPSQDPWNWRSSILTDTVGAIAPRGSDELDISELPQNGCGIPWNWSRIHSRGRNLLDIAGKSISCGASDYATRKAGNTSRGHQSSSGESMPAITSEFSDSSFNTDSESLPLLDPASRLNSGSQSEQGPGEELGLDQRESSGIRSRNRSRQLLEERILPGGENRHHSLSQKYMPKAFHDIVGQHLVTQALTNSLSRGRVAPMYIFYGPRGTGKTSCARVFAAALKCLSSEKQRPCGSCQECLAHKLGKTSIVSEVNAGGNHGVRGIKAIMHDIARFSSSQYKVYIMDECHALSNQAWNAFLKVVEEAPRNIVFILSTSSLEELPHAVISRSQKFLFSKIKESEIINRLQLIAEQERLDADAEAFKLIASACDGSLQDAETMLDQLSLLGQKVSLSMVQELMGLIPDDKLVELLDLSLSADTVNTVRSLRDLMESGVEPLNLMSQLAGLITSILAGGYQLPKERHKRKFFRKKELTKEDMERLRQALKILSEAEKQLRGASDRMTWLTAALLQFAPDQSYLLPNSSVDTSVTQSPIGQSNTIEIPVFNPFPQKQVKLHDRYAGYSEPGPIMADQAKGIRISESSKISASDPRQQPCTSSQSPQRSCGSRGPKVMFETLPLKASSSTRSDNYGETSSWQTTITNKAELEDVWQRVLDAVHSNSLRKFLQTEGRLLSLTLRKGFAVAVLEFLQLEHTSRAERSRTSIAHAFQVTLGYRVEIKVLLASTKEDPLTRQAISVDRPSNTSNSGQPEWISGNGKAQQVAEPNTEDGQRGINLRGVHQKRSQPLESHETFPTHFGKPESKAQKTNESSEIVALETKRAGSLSMDVKNHSYDEKLESAWVQGACSHEISESPYKTGKHHGTATFRSNSTGKSRVSLGFVIQQAEGSVDGYSQDLQFDHMNRGSYRNQSTTRGSECVYTAAQQGNSAMAAKLEEENMRLESRSGGLLCWKTTEKGHEKVKQLQEGSRRPGFLLSIFPCAKSNRS